MHENRYKRVMDKGSMAESNQKAEKLENIRKLLDLADKYGLEELTVSEDDLTVTVKGFTAPKAAFIAAAPVDAAQSVAVPDRARPKAKSQGQKAKPASASGPRLSIVSPMTGVFYRTPSPDSPPFIEVGDIVSEGQTVGMIEAMKVFSEVPAEVSGRVVEIVAESGKLVNSDDPLIYLEPVEGE